MTTKYKNMDATPPHFMNVETVTYEFPTLSRKPMAVTLGKPDVGSAIPEEHKNAAAMTNKFG